MWEAWKERVREGGDRRERARRKRKEMEMEMEKEKEKEKEKEDRVKGDEGDKGEVRLDEERSVGWGHQ